MSLRDRMRAAIEQQAARVGIDPAALRAFVDIESGGNPAAKTGSYHGALQLSEDEFKRRGGSDIYNLEQNIGIGADKLAENAAYFRRQFGREPQPHELYLVHQQGVGGGPAHLRDPEDLAWRNMAETGEGRKKGADWAKAAVWGNLTPDAQKRFGSVDNITSGQFVDFWKDRVGGKMETPSNAVSTVANSNVVSPMNAVAPPWPAAAPAAPQAPSSGGFLDNLTDAVAVAAPAPAMPQANPTNAASTLNAQAVSSMMQQARQRLAKLRGQHNALS